MLKSLCLDASFQTIENESKVVTVYMYNICRYTVAESNT